MVKKSYKVAREDGYLLLQGLHATCTASSYTYPGILTLLNVFPVFFDVSGRSLPVCCYLSNEDDGVLL